MRREDWPERLAKYVRERGDVGDAQWIAGWLEECGGVQDGEVAWPLAQRGDIVEFSGGYLAICVGRYAIGPDGPMREMSNAVRAWRVR